MRYWIDFCEKNMDYHEQEPEIDVSSDIYDFMESFSVGDYENFYENLAKLWKEYCLFRINFFEIELKNRFKKYNIDYNLLIKNSKDWKIRYIRNQPGLFPLQKKIDDNKFTPEYQLCVSKLMLRLDSHNDSQTLEEEKFLQENGRNSLNYLYVWTGVYWLFCMGSDTDDNAFDRIVSNMSEDLPKDKQSTLFEICSTYLVTELGKLADKLSGHTDDKIEGKNSGLIKTLLTETHKKEFSDLIEYIIQDVILSIYETARRNNYLDICKNKYYIINRLALVMYNDLFFSKNLFAPNLKCIWKIIWNYCVYLACIARGVPENVSNYKYFYQLRESFFIKQYALLRDTFYNEIEIGIDLEMEMKSNQVISCQNLLELKLYVSELLHTAACENMVNYCQLLIEDGAKISVDSDVYKVAKRIGLTRILAKFDQFINKTEMKTTDSPTNSPSDAANTASKTGTAGAAIEENYYQFRKLWCFARYFLVGINGCKVENRYYNLNHDLIKGTTMYIDEFYVPINQMAGLKETAHVDKVDDEKANLIQDKNIRSQNTSTMREMVIRMIDLINKKVVICDAMLILCFEYCKYNDNKLLHLFIETLKNAVLQCLDDELIKKSQKVRNYIWFKKYLLHSNVWLCKNVTNEKDKTSGVDGDILYHCIDGIVDNGLFKQQKYIWDNIKQEEKDNVQEWNKIVNFANGKGDDDDEHKIPQNVQLRQDAIPNGIKSSVSNVDGFLIQSKMGENTDFDVFSSYDSDIYLTQLLVQGHKMNNRFQTEMKQLFHQISNKCKYQSAPVKLRSRILVKAQTDYANLTWPRSACVVDLLRGSITFDNVTDMYNTLNQFIQIIENNKSKNKNGGQSLTCVIDILRIKNGFSNVQNWIKIKDCQYVDIKLNVLIYDSESNVSIIGELQFLLKWLLKSKRMGHKWYGIKRKSEFIESNCQLLYNIDCNYNEYKSKIGVFVENNDLERLGNELLLEPNLGLSIIDSPYETANGFHVPFLYQLSQFMSTTATANFKMFQLFMNSLIHFGEVILNSSEGKDKDKDKEKEEAPGTKWLRKYFNFNNGDMVISYDYFWGVSTELMKSMDDVYCKMIKMIMECDYFNGVSKTRYGAYGTWINHLVDTNNICFLKIFIDTWQKNEEMLIKSINEDEPLSLLINGRYCTKEWLDLYFKCGELVKTQVSASVLKKALENCQSKDREQFKQIIQSYVERNQIQID